jgi:hypothetical protein
MKRRLGNNGARNLRRNFFIDPARYLFKLPKSVAFFTRN